MKRLLTVIGLGCALLLHPAGSAAQPIHIDCSGSTPGAFTSIGAALAASDPLEPRTMTVTGTCQEAVAIEGRRNLTIVAALGAVVEARLQPRRPTLGIRDSARILVQGLTIRGDGIRIENSSVEIDDVTSEDSTLAGLAAVGHTNLRVTNSRMLNNAGPGVSLENGARVSLAMIETRGNSVGVSNLSSDLLVEGSLTAEENRGIGVSARGGWTRLSSGRGRNTIRGNRQGIALTHGAAAVLAGDTVISDNAGIGIEAALGASLELGSVPANGTSLVTTIEHNGSMGVNLAGSASATVNGPHLIRKNGQGGPGQPGLRVGSTSRIQFNGQAEISGNSGPGVIAEWNAAVFLGGVSVLNNAAEGVRVLRNSVTMLGGMIAGNGGASVTCDMTGLVVLQTTAITGVRCARVEREHGPLPPGWIK